MRRSRGTKKAFIEGIQEKRGLLRGRKKKRERERERKNPTVRMIKGQKNSESGNRTPGYPVRISSEKMRADNVSHYTNSDWLKEQNLTGPILCGERKHKPPRFIRSNLHNRLGTRKLYIQAHASNIFCNQLSRVSLISPGS